MFSGLEKNSFQNLSSCLMTVFALSEIFLAFIFKDIFHIICMFLTVLETYLLNQGVFLLLFSLSYWLVIINCIFCLIFTDTAHISSVFFCFHGLSSLCFTLFCFSFITVTFEKFVSHMVRLITLSIWNE